LRIVGERRPAAAQDDAAVDDDRVGARTVTDGDELVDRIDAGIISALGRADHDIGALSRFETADQVRVPPPARPDRHHLEHVLRNVACPAPPASCSARKPASPDELCRAESVPSATLTPRFFISGIRVFARSGVPRDTYASGHQTIDSPDRRSARSRRRG
jgi:hypothetical protein